MVALQSPALPTRPAPVVGGTVAGGAVARGTAARRTAARGAVVPGPLVRGAAIVILVQAVAILVLPGLWWAYDRGPLTLDPELVLTEPSPTGAVRAYGDHADLDVDTAARATVDDLDAAGGFDRDVLVVTIPTGSGWVDANQVEALEQWADGDVATVGMRYSAAPSSVVYLLNPDEATESARALLTEVVDRLRLMPEDDRPALVVHGQSLGATAGVEVLADPRIASFVDTTLWQGRPGAAADSRGSAATDESPASPDDPAASPDGSARCEVSATNADDAVTKLSWGLLLDPAEAVRVVTELPGMDSKDPGTGHSYLPVTPPEECVPPPT